MENSVLSAAQRNLMNELISNLGLINIILGRPAQPLPEISLTINEIRNIEWGVGVLSLRQELKHALRYNRTSAVGLFEKLSKQKDEIVSLISNRETAIWNLERLQLNLTINVVMNFIVDVTLTGSQNHMKCIQNMLLCYQRRQQHFGIGIDVHPESIVEVSEIERFSNQLLNFIHEMVTLIQGALRFNLISETDCTAHINSLKRMESLMYKKLFLFVTQQPQPVVKTEQKRTTPVEVGVLNFKNNWSHPVHLQVYLINEAAAVTVREELPNNLVLAGTVISVGSTNIDKGGSKRKKNSSTQNEYFRVAPYGVQVGANPEETTSPPQTGIIMEFQECSKEKPYFNMPLGLEITEVIRNNATEIRGKANTVANEKYCLLFVTELFIRGEVVKVWTTSLPFAITSNSCHKESSWAAIAVDYAFPASNREGFKVRESAKWHQFSEMLKSLFKKWTGVRKELNASQLKCIGNKLKSCIGDSFPVIPLDEIIRGDTLFWCWFYRASLIVKGHLKEAWENNLFEAFIDLPDAYALLRNVKIIKVGTFIIRLSDSQPGSVSIVALVRSPQSLMLCKVDPLELYKKLDPKKFSQALLKQLNCQDIYTQEEVLQYVYPKIPKREAFKTFYPPVSQNGEGSQNGGVTNGSHGYSKLCTVIDTSVGEAVNQKNVPASALDSLNQPFNRNDAIPSEQNPHKDVKQDGASTITENKNDAPVNVSKMTIYMENTPTMIPNHEFSSCNNGVLTTFEERNPTAENNIFEDRDLYELLDAVVDMELEKEQGK